MGRTVTTAQLMALPDVPAPAESDADIEAEIGRRLPPDQSPLNSFRERPAPPAGNVVSTSELFSDQPPPESFPESEPARYFPYGDTRLPDDQEEQFQQLFQQWALKNNRNPDPDDPEHHYDARAAFAAGERPDASGHWSSRFKLQGNLRRFQNADGTFTPDPKDDNSIDTVTGQKVPSLAGAPPEPRTPREGANVLSSSQLEIPGSTEAESARAELERLSKLQGRTPEERDRERELLHIVESDPTLSLDEFNSLSDRELQILREQRQESDTLSQRFTRNISSMAHRYVPFLNLAEDVAEGRAAARTRTGVRWVDDLFEGTGLVTSATIGQVWKPIMAQAQDAFNLVRIAESAAGTMSADGKVTPEKLQAYEDLFFTGIPNEEVATFAPSMTEGIGGTSVTAQVANSGLNLFKLIAAQFLNDPINTVLMLEGARRMAFRSEPPPERPRYTAHPEATAKRIEIKPVPREPARAAPPETPEPAKPSEPIQPETPPAVERPAAATEPARPAPAEEAPRTEPPQESAPGAEKAPKAVTTTGALFNTPESEPVPVSEWRPAAVDYMTKDFEKAGVPREQIQAAMQPLDWRARKWSEQTGRPVDEWWRTRIMTAKEPTIPSKEKVFVPKETPAAAAPEKPAKGTPKPKTGKETGLDPLRAFVIENGGIRSFKLTAEEQVRQREMIAAAKARGEKPTKLKPKYHEEMQGLPLRFRRKTGLALDEMHTMLVNEGLMPPESSAFDLIERLQGKSNVTSETAYLKRREEMKAAGFETYWQDLPPEELARHLELVNRRAAGEKLKPEEEQELLAGEGQVARRGTPDNQISKTPPPSKYYIRVGGKTYPINSLQEASTKWNASRDALGMGVREMSEYGIVDPIILDSSGNPIGWVSYNGRLWKGDPIRDSMENRQTLTEENASVSRQSGKIEEGGQQTLFQETPQTESPEFQNWFGESKVVDNENNPLVVYHGAQRADRIGTRFRKSRATSGPMAFFTDSPELASKYSTAKRDTSFDVPLDYSGWFKFKAPGSRAEINIDQAWNRLTPEQRTTVAERAPQIWRGEEGEKIQLGSPGNRGLGGYDQHLKEANGNHLKALVEEWLSSGALFNEESEFLKVLKVAGLDKGIRFDDPYREQSGVFPVYLSIKNPLDTSNIPKDVISALEQAARGRRGPPRGRGADQWDKRFQNPKDWIDRLREDAATGKSSFAWSAIPDWVTDTLKLLGYDGIRDTGGKMGGQEHSVWIPFEETQVKSAIGNRGTFDPNNPNILFQETEAPADPFYSQLDRAVRELPQEKMSVQQLRAMLPKMGVKAEEIEWTGLEEFLRGKETVTKTELAEAIRPIEVTEVVKGSGAQNQKEAKARAERIVELDNQRRTRERALDRQGYYVTEDPGGMPGEVIVERRTPSDGREVVDEADIPAHLKPIVEHLAGIIYEQNEIHTGSVNFAAVEEARLFSALSKIEKENGAEGWAKKTFEGIIEGRAESIGNAESSGIPDELISPFRDRGGGPTQFDTFTLPGGENYRELLLTLPERVGSNFEVRTKGSGHGVWDVTNNEWVSTTLAKEVAEQDALRMNRAIDNQTFRSNHFSEPNILAHVRFNERTDASGKRALFIEEIQSDWHQKGREYGYNVKPDMQAIIKKAAEKTDLDSAVKDIQDAIGETDGGHAGAFFSDSVVEEWNAAKTPAEREAILQDYAKIEPKNSLSVPDAPFKKTWHELAMKRMIRWAAENGFDRIAWTTGDQQVQRYDLSKRLDSIEWQRSPHEGPAVYNIRGVNDGREIIHKDGISESQLSNFVGKDVARQIIEGSKDQTKGSISGENLRIGGEGMRGFYDKMLVDTANKLGKRFGAKVGQTEIRTGVKLEPSGRTAADGYEFKKTLPDFVHVHSLDITPSMKSSVLREGQSLFQEDKPPSWEEQPNLFIKTPKLTNAERQAALQASREQAAKPGIKRASITFLETAEGEKAAIKALESPNVSSFIHETGHLFRRDLYRTAQETGDLQMARDIKTTEEWAGVKDGKWTREAEEKFARGFEKYILSAEPPNSSVGRVFNALKRWMGEVYSRFKSRLPEITDEMKAVFDRLIDISPERELAEALGVEKNPKTTIDQVLLKQVHEAKIRAKQAVAETKGAAKTGIAGVVDGAKGIAKELRTIKKFSSIRRQINRWAAEVQISLHEIEAMERQMLRLVPEKINREAISVYREAGGNNKVIWNWIDQLEKSEVKVPQKYIKIFEQATQLDPQSRKIAAALDRFYQRKLEEGQKIYLLNQGKKNYATHIWETKGEKVAGLFGGSLKKRFAFAERSSYKNFFDGLMHGDTPKTMDAAELAGIYAGEFSKVKLTREFVKDGAKTIMEDGRPMFAPQGTASAIVIGEKGAESTINLRPGQVTSDYRSFDHPAFRDWNVKAVSSEGEPVTVRGNLAIHPEAIRWVRAAIGKSKIREWYESEGTAVMAGLKTAVKWADTAQSTVKQAMFSLSGFHFTSIGVHGASLRINPIPGKFKINPGDPLQRFLIEHSLKVFSSGRELEKFSEGLSSGSGVHRIPILGDVAKKVTDYLFHDYIPGMKMKTALELFRRNMKTYAKEIARGEVNVDDIGYLSARQANYAYGELNYADMGRNPTLQHILRATLVAPDYIEAKFGFVGQALRAGGRQPLMAFATAATFMFVVTRILNKLLDDDYHWDYPFNVVVGNRKYNVRTDPFDVFQGFKDFNAFVSGRVSPVLGEFARWLVTKRDWRGQRVEFHEEVMHLLHNAVPISFRNDQDVNAWEQFLNGMGIHVGRYSPNWSVKRMAIDWMEANGYGIDNATYPTSQYAKMRGALEDDNLDTAFKEYLKLVEAKGPKAVDGFKDSLFHPFTNSKSMDGTFYNSLDVADKKLFNRAVERRKEIFRRFAAMIRSMNDEQKKAQAAAIEEYKKLKAKQRAAGQQ